MYTDYYLCEGCLDAGHLLCAFCKQTHFKTSPLNLYYGYDQGATYSFILIRSIDRVLTGLALAYANRRFFLLRRVHRKLAIRRRQVQAALPRAPLGQIRPHHAAHKAPRLAAYRGDGREVRCTGDGGQESQRRRATALANLREERLERREHLPAVLELGSVSRGIGGPGFGGEEVLIQISGGLGRTPLSRGKNPQAWWNIQCLTSYLVVGVRSKLLPILFFIINR